MPLVIQNLQFICARILAGNVFIMDNIAKRIFKTKIFDKEKLEKFGFKKCGKTYTYKQKLLDNQFELTITISTDKQIETKMTDLSSNDIYTLHLIEDADGTFVGKVRETYETFLENLAGKCCVDTPFIFPQSNRLSNLIKEKYNTTPEFLWEKFPGFGVFRNQKSGKWFGLISNIDKSKLDKKHSGEIEILNIKLDKDEILELVKKSGFYPAYHMNKKSWITIILDDTIPDKNIINLIDKSYKFSEPKQNIKNKKG